MPDNTTSDPRLAARVAFEAKLLDKNIAKGMDSSMLANIGAQVVAEYDIDNASRETWMRGNEQAQKMVDFTMQVKDWPHKNSSNVKYPLVAEAAIQVKARIFPTIIKGDNVVKGRVVGKDPGGAKAARAQRVSEFMSYQILNLMDGWKESMSKLITVFSITGCEFKKTYWDKTVRRPVSKYLSSKNLIINNNAESLESTPRITEEMFLYPHEVEERIRAGKFIDQEYTPVQKDGNDTAVQTVFLEQHVRRDIDGDGYPEPMIITVHKDTMKVARISAGYDSEGIYLDERGKLIHIEPVQYYTKYGFMSSFDNSFYDIGYGTIMGAFNESINTILNQLFDAGTDQNTGGGLIDGSLNIKAASKMGGQLIFDPGQYYVTEGDSSDDIRKKIWARPTAQPSIVLLNLLTLLIQNYEKFASYTSALSGGQQPANTPYALYSAQVNEGLRVLTEIAGRVFESMRSEFKKIYRLNHLYLEEGDYYRVLDEDKAVVRADYDESDCDIVPVSDAESMTDTQKIMKAELLKGLMGTGLNDMVIIKRYLEAAGIDNIDELLPDPKEQPQPNLEERKIVIEEARVAMEKERLPEEIAKLREEALTARANALKTLADAEAVEAGDQTEEYNTQLRDLQAQIYVLSKGSDSVIIPEETAGGAGIEQGGMAGMVGEPGNGDIPPESPGVAPEEVGAPGVVPEYGQRG